METVNVTYTGLAGDNYQAYQGSDLALIQTNYITPTFGSGGDYVEYFIRDLSGNIIASNYNSTSYQIDSSLSQDGVTSTGILVDPEADIRFNGYNRGTVSIKYNFFTKYLQSSQTATFWIKEISTSRTEIRVVRQDLSNGDLQNAFVTFNNTLQGDNYYPDFYLNFGNDNQVIAVNAVYTLETDGIGYVLFKLYEPLPSDFDIKSTFWVVGKAAESVEYTVDISVAAETVVAQNQLRGPNYKIDIAQKAGQTTPYYTYTSLFNTSVSSSYQQLQSMFDEKGLSINVDYSAFDNFIHFSSIEDRLNNFVYKLELIEAAQAGLVGVNTATAKTALQANINSIITKFDGYEHYLYFSSASTAWPKSTSTQPYTLYSVTSSQAINWLGSVDTQPSAGSMSMLYSASVYDELNSDALRYTAPAYIRDDSSNQPYLTFLDMIGQHFDNIWIYYKDVTTRYSAENNPNVGISMDLVSDALKGFGMELYTNTNVSNNIYYSLLGINPDGSLLPPTGSEHITNYVTSSIATLPAQTITDEVYKRLYHNLAYLYKTRGTERGVKALIACYGIPDTTLTINEFGGYQRGDQLDVQGIQNNKIFSGSSNEIGSTVLSPFTTIQRYQNDTIKNSISLEVGFSPADSINADIAGYIGGDYDVESLIADPALQYSSSYDPLVATSNTYFAANYTHRYNVWDFIRVIKYYNNSIFKMIKDFVPARASLSTGIIIKSHMLERNKYARHEPTATTSSITNDWEKLEMLKIYAADGGFRNITSSYTENVPTALGYVPLAHNQSFEKYTGEYSGSEFKADYSSTPQVEQSYNPNQTTIAPIDVQLIGNYQNVLHAPKSKQFLELDYTAGQSVPSNLGLVTQSIAWGAVSQSNPYGQYAEVQDYNYALRRSILPRYSGSKSISLKYNTYSSASATWPGDSSYGNNPAIDHNSYKVGWIKSIPSQNLNFYDKTQINLKYLVDANVDTVELNSHNNNLFEVQNIFKSGDLVTVSLSDIGKPSNQRSLDGTKSIWKGGFRYDPILFRENNEPLTFTFDQPISSASVNLGFNAYSPYSLYYSKVDAQSPTPPSSIFGAANSPIITVNGQAITDQAIAVEILSANWQYNGSGPLVDYNNYDSDGNNLGAFNSNGVGTAYGFQLPLFTDTRIQSPYLQNGNAYSYEDPSVFQTLNGSTVYTVPRTSTYTIDGTIAISILFHAYQHTVNLKLVGIVEQSTTPDIEGSWTGLVDDNGKLMCTVLSEQGPHATGDQDSTVSYDFRVDTFMNHIIQSATTKSGPDLFLCETSTRTVTLTAGTSLRFKFYWIDLQDGCFDGSFNVIQFTLGEPRYTYFNVVDTLTTETLYQNTLEYQNSIPLFTTSSANTLQFSTNTKQFFSQSCIFTSTGSTSNYYSDVVDYFSIQQGDLIRLGNFYSKLSQTYEVLSTGSYQKAPITVNARIRFILGSGNIHAGGGNFTSYIEYLNSSLPGNPNQYFSPGDLIQISGSAYLPNGKDQFEYIHNTTTLFPVLNTATVGGYARVYLDTIIFSETPFNQSVYDTARYLAGFTSNNPFIQRTFTFPVAQTTVTLDQPITNWTTYNSQNFAILRQKPDETSVLINYIKQPGEVSPAILTPYDANATILAAQSTIFTTLNQSLI